ncbi:hypothetical protein ACHAWF_017566 [Thalassiosira exigua]
MVDLGMPNADSTKPIYNDNRGAINWSKNVTNNRNKHFNMRKNKVRKVPISGDAAITHIFREINSPNIFTKETKDNTHFCCLRNSFMVSCVNFIRFFHTVPIKVKGKTMSFYSSPFVSDNKKGNDGTTTSVMMLKMKMMLMTLFMIQPLQVVISRWFTIDA